MNFNLKGIFLDRLNEQDWQDLHANSASSGTNNRHKYALFGQSWFESWSEHYLPTPRIPGPVRYIAVKDEKQTTLGIMPYVILNLRGVNIMSLAGYYYPFRGIAMRSDIREPVIKALAEAIRTRRDINAICFGPVEENDPVVTRLIDELKTHHWLLHDIDCGQQQIVPLPADRTTFEKSLSKNLRSNIKRRHKKMQQDGTVELKSYHDLDGLEWDRIIDQIALIESRSWLAGDSDGEPRFHGERNSRFWKHLLSRSDVSRAASAWLLYFNDQPVCFSFAIDAGDCRYNIAGQYDEAVKEYGPGWIVDQHLFFDAIDKGLTSVNMGDGYGYYKSRWGAIPGAHLRNFVVFQPSLVGQGMRLAALSKERIERLRLRSRKSVAGMKSVIGKLAVTS